MELGVRIAERLAELGISQSELARRAQIPQTTINSLIKKPRRSSPHLVRIARELMTTPAYLTGESDRTDSELPEMVPLSSDEQDFVDLLRGLAPKDRAAVLQLTRTIAHSAQSASVNAPAREYRPA